MYPRVAESHRLAMQPGDNATEKQRDPVCGMMVDPARAAATVEHAGKKYYFCATSCAGKFQASPGKYLAPKPAAAGLIGIAALGTSRRSPIAEAGSPASQPATKPGGSAANLQARA